MTNRPKSSTKQAEEVQEEVKAPEPQLIVTAQWVIDRHDGRIDHACAECIGIYNGTSTAVDGFRCVYHRAQYVKLFPAASVRANPVDVERLAKEAAKHVVEFLEMECDDFSLDATATARLTAIIVSVFTAKDQLGK